MPSHTVTHNYKQMRTKALLCAAALAAGAVASMAQSNVYSLNVVGYVNYPFNITGDLYLVYNPLDNTNNDLNTIVPTAPDGSSVALWNEAIQDFSTVAPLYSTFTHAWNPDSSIAPGQGFFMLPNAPFTNTFIGNVRQTAVNYSVLGGGNLACLGSSVPLSGGVTNQLAGYPTVDGDSLAIWNVAIQDFSSIAPLYSTFTHVWNPDYNFTPGEGFFLLRNSGAVSWSRTFTVQ